MDAVRVLKSTVEHRRRNKLLEPIEHNIQYEHEAPRERKPIEHLPHQLQEQSS